MIEIHENYIVNDKGEKTAVIINIEEYTKIMEILRSLSDIDCVDVNYKIARGLKDIEEGKIYPLTTIFGDENDAPRFRVTETFQKDIKRLKKKYPNVLKDLSEVLNVLDEYFEVGDRIMGLNKLVYKIRVPSSDMKRGKSGGFRTIYYVINQKNEIILVTIYAKSKQENISPLEIQEI